MHSSRGHEGKPERVWSEFVVEDIVPSLPFSCGTSFTLADPILHLLLKLRLYPATMRCRDDNLNHVLDACLLLTT